MLPLSIRLKVAAVGVAGALSLLRRFRRTGRDCHTRQPADQRAPERLRSRSRRQFGRPRFRAPRWLRPSTGRSRAGRSSTHRVAGRFRSFTHLAAGSSARGRHMVKRSDRGSSPSPPACPSGRATASAWPPIPPAPHSETVAPPQARPSIAYIPPLTDNTAPRTASTRRQSRARLQRNHRLQLHRPPGQGQAREEGEKEAARCRLHQGQGQEEGRQEGDQAEAARRHGGPARDARQADARTLSTIGLTDARLRRSGVVVGDCDRRLDRCRGACRDWG